MRLEPWELWFRKHRGSELARIVVRLSEVLLARGVCTADDARAVPLRGDPRIRGGAMRALVHLGIAEMGEAVKSTSDTCHHRPIQRFILLDSRVARMICQRFAVDVLDLGPQEIKYAQDAKGQYLLAV